MNSTRSLCFTLLLVVLCIKGAFSIRPILAGPDFEDRNLILSGGSFHSPAGAKALFSNPAALAPSGLQQLEIGALSLPGNPSPYFALASRANEIASYGLGYFYDDRQNTDHQGFAAGFTLSPGRYLTIGGAALTQAIENQYGVDFSAGMIYKPLPVMQLGLAIKNIQEAGIGQKPDGFETRRNYRLSMGLHHRPWPFTAHYEVRTSFLAPDRYRHLLSLGIAPPKELGFRSGGLGIQSGMEWSGDGFSFSVGLALDFPLGTDAIGYGQEWGSHSPHGHSLQSMTFRFSRAGNLDLNPPSVDAKILNPILRLTPGTQESLDFILRAEDVEGNLEAWYLVICTVNSKGEPTQVFHSMTGKNGPPEKLKWDGRDSSDKTLPAGYYCFRLISVDQAGNSGRTAWQLFEISNP